MLSTLQKLESLGFDDYQIAKLMKGSNKGGLNQEHLIIKIQEPLAKQFKFSEVSCILAGSCQMSLKIQNSVT